MSEYTPKQARLLAGKSQDEMAKALNIHRQTYAKLEKNPEQITIAQAHVFAEYVGIDYDRIKFFCSQPQL